MTTPRLSIVWCDMHQRVAFWMILLSLALMACLAQPQEAAPRIVTATALPPALVIAQNTDESTQRATPPPPTPVLATPEPRIEPCIVQADSVPRALYDATLELDWAERRAVVEADITYTNTTGAALTALVFQVESNRTPNTFVLTSASDSEAPELAGTRLTLPLSDGLGENCKITVTLRYTLNIPAVEQGYYGRFGYLGYTNRQINLGHWLPTIALYQTDWYAPQSHFVGEQTLVEASDFKARLTLLNAPPTVAVAAPGIVRQPEAFIWEAQLDRARDLSFSVGDGFRRENLTASDGTALELYYYPKGGELRPAEHALQAADEALKLYTELYGMSYPYPRLVIVEGDFPDGMEFSGLVFVGEAWFRGWTGLPNSWLTVITVHEVAHQWWYAMVGNDPAQNPYMDEAFATYSEYLYFERYFPDQTEWWWMFRVRGYDTTTSLVDASIYGYPDARTYINAAYLRGAEMLHTLRASLGDEAFFAWLKTYMNTQKFAIATPLELWGAMPPDVYQQSAGIRQQFLGQAEILPTLEPTPTAEATARE